MSNYAEISPGLNYGNSMANDIEKNNYASYNNSYTFDSKGSQSNFSNGKLFTNGYIDYGNKDKNKINNKGSQERQSICNKKPEALKGNIIDGDKLSDIFFSKENIKRVQKKIKNEILLRTNGKYRLDEEQDEDDLMIMMRQVFLQDAKHLSNHIVRQVKILNEKVVQSAVPDMITNIKQYYGYLKDINTPLQPMMQPLNVNNAGRNTLPSISTLWSL